MPGWSHHIAVKQQTAGNLSVGVTMPDNGQVERMNHTIKEATVKRFHYDTHDQLHSHLGDYVSAYNFGGRLKTRKGLTPYEAICKACTTEPKRFTRDPIHQMPRLNTCVCR